MAEDARRRFNGDQAPALAAQAGVPERWNGRGSARFAYFADDQHFAIVAGQQEGAHVDRALAYGLTYRGDHRLVLVLPRDAAFPTLQRSAWLVSRARPRIYLHDGQRIEAVPVPSEQDTVSEVLKRLQGKTPAEELAAATTPAHLGRRSKNVAELVEWAARHPQLDPGHRKGERAWHCVGQKVLSLHGTTGGVRVKAGIHGTGPGTEPASVFVPVDEPLAGSELAHVQQRVDQGVAARLTGSFHKPDEHWLQAVIRRQPSLAGIEQPALRELPAWRPAVGRRRWGRGYIDLVGVDPHGNVRIVETKLAANRDELLILQGVDYYIWAQAYARVLRQRLGAPRRSQLVLHYLVGATPAGKVHLSRFAPAQAEALSFPWRFQTVTDWFHPPAAPGHATARLLPSGELPT